MESNTEREPWSNTRKVLTGLAVVAAVLLLICLVGVVLANTPSSDQRQSTNPSSTAAVSASPAAN